MSRSRNHPHQDSNRWGWVHGFGGPSERAAKSRGRSAIPLFQTYLDFHNRLGFRGLTNSWAQRKVLDPAAAWFRADESDALDLTFLIYQKRSGYPSVIDGQDSRHPTEHQKSRAREEAQKIIDKYRQGTTNPY
jgi:hypothetical protein